MLEDTSLPLPDSNNVSLTDSQAKRIRLTLPPISLAPPNVSNSYSSYKPSFPSSIHENNNFILPPYSPIVVNQSHELPSINSLCSLPPLTNFIPTTAPPVNPMSVSAILSSEESSFARGTDTNSNENGQHDYTSPKVSSSSLPTPLKLVQPIIEGMSEIENLHRMRREQENNANAGTVQDTGGIENGNQNFASNDSEEDDEVGEHEGENEDEYDEEENDEEENEYDNDVQSYFYHDESSLMEPQVVVENDEALNMEGREERHLGMIFFSQVV